MSYVYKRTERQLWTVGHYAPDGQWTPESDHDTPVSASERVIVLNGGTPTLPAAGARTIVFELDGSELDELVASTKDIEALVQLWPGETPTIALRRDRGTWGPPRDATTDEDEGLRQVAIQAADRMLRQRIEAITDERLRRELLDAL